MALGAVDEVHDPRRVWLSIEAFLADGSANRRARGGLCERVLADRYRLVAAFGIFQTFACKTDIWLAQPTWPTTSSMIGSISPWARLIETVGVCMLFLAFFPPAFDRHFVSGSSPSVAETVGG